MTRDRTAARWGILTLLAALGLVTYLVRMNLSVAAKFIMPELGLDEIQMGQIFTAFMIGYAACQIPAGMVADRWGPRRVLVTALLGWAVITVLTGLLPGVVLTGSVMALVTFMVLRLVLGILESPAYPAGARSIQAWFSPPERSLAFAIIIAGTMLGSAVTPPIIASLMVAVGWRQSFYLVTIAPLLVAALCWRYLNDPPAEHSFAAAGLERPSNQHHALSLSSVFSLLRDKTLLLHSISYFLLGCLWYLYIFWFFLYLVDVRGFSVLKGGLFGSFPFFAATIMTPLGGALADRLAKKRGTFTGRRWAALLGFTSAAACLVAGANANNAYLAIGLLSLGLGFLEFTEGPFWAGAVEIGGARAGTASGVLNMFNNLGGVVAGAVTPYVARSFGWIAVLGTAGGLALLAGILWLGHRPPGGERAPMTDTAIAQSTA